MGKRFFLFVVLIRALAAIAITNSHYTDVYPSNLIANGGLLGDVLFFSVSGFCLASTKISFGNWYLKRFIRIYIPTWITTIFYVLIGAYYIIGWEGAFTSFIWPTHWHFIASIIMLYIPLYFVSKYIVINRKNYWILTVSLFLLQLFIYLTVYDYHYYHIDTVREPMIEFIFFQSMLMGLYYRWRCEKLGDINKKHRLCDLFLLIFFFCAYFASKIIFSTYQQFAQFQIINQIILWALLFMLFDFLMKLERYLERKEKTKTWKCISFISERTLEIYLVQYVIIQKCKIGPFPLNWLILTSIILLAAIILHILSQRAISKLNKFLF